MTIRIGVLTKAALATTIITAAAFFANTPAARASTYDLSGLGVNLNISTDAANNITGATGTFLGDTVDLAGGQPGGVTGSPGGFFNYDNILFPTQSPALDNDGLLLAYVSGLGSYTYANIFAVHTNGDGGLYTLYEDNGFNTNEALTLTATPLPSTWTMLIAGFIGLGFLVHRRTNNSTAPFIAA